MQSYYLTIHLHSDATFGRGEGLAGLVDIEIEHDEYGCPTIGARTIKGLLVEEWANLRFALGDEGAVWDATAALLFGGSGANEAARVKNQDSIEKDETAGDEQPIGAARLHFADATLPPDLHAALLADKAMTPTRILAALTATRRQTSMNTETGAPEQSSLRAARVVLRGTQLIARLDLDLDTDNQAIQSEEGEQTTRPEDTALGLLAACVVAVRRGGTARNRGRGRLSMLLHDHEPVNYDDSGFTKHCFEYFVKKVQS